MMCDQGKQSDHQSGQHLTEPKKTHVKDRLDPYRVCVIGAGSIGLWFGGISSLFADVTFITRRVQQADRLVQNGVKLIRDEKAVIRGVDAYPMKEIRHDPSFLRQYDLIVVSVKQYQLPSVMTFLQDSLLTEQNALYFLMNGMSHLGQRYDVINSPIYLGMTQSGATRLSDTDVQERGLGLTLYGRYDPDQSLSTPSCPPSHSRESGLWQCMKEGFNEHHVPFEYTDHVWMPIIQKCIVNACINPLTALFRVQNGELIADETLHILLMQAYEELASFISDAYPEQADKILKQGKLKEEIIDICRITSGNISSMLQDIRASRETEIDAINGYFIRMAEKQQLGSLPTHNFLYRSIKYLEQQN
ncbi:2-dehydropantoate 2-reductase [Caldalkalibacillus salinus]|uniref:2-dehydropantoate 2-reductase n=1 Tax=Caldalkalibacillus salinus TaxID=2803787 RepID=UPI0019241BED|nr:2-dehydropantoate 2-reductase [Caldalkalibacillus salinus]